LVSARRSNGFLEADVAIGLHDHLGVDRWRHVFGLDPGEIALGDPTGLGAALSDVDLDSRRNASRQELGKGRHADPRTFSAAPGLSNSIASPAIAMLVSIWFFTAPLTAIWKPSDARVGSSGPTTVVIKSLAIDSPPQFSGRLREQAGVL
jgi:hypothetical protein